MPPPRRHISDLGEALRAARQVLHLDQVGLAQRVPTSSRQVSRWENGLRPDPVHAARILDVFASIPAPLYAALADALGVELPDAEEAPPPPPPPQAPQPVLAPAPIVPPPPARPSTAELRASFDAIIFAVAEQRDVLPRHLRAFAVELFQGADRLGVSAKEAALLVAVPERSGAVKGTKQEG
jgi:transcriptional regulator with XRE-family HTH domain